MTIDRSARVFVAWHRGLVGSALVRRLESTYRWYLDQIAHNDQLRGIDREVTAAR